MKKAILMVLLVSSFTSHSQTLKDILYSGKLKSDTGSVVRKSDDLKSKIDTAAKKPVEPPKPKQTIASTDSSMKGSIAITDSTVAPVAEPNTNVTVAKDNTKAWKEYMDSLVSTMKTEVLPHNKIKEGTYYILVEYEIGTDGQVSVNNVSSTPENSWLLDQVKQRITLTAPVLTPVLANGKPRKVLKKYNFTVTK